jgi:hypothetical protein
MDKLLLWLSLVVLREEIWSFDSQSSIQGVMVRLRSRIEDGSYSQWFPKEVNFFGSEKQFIGRIHANSVEIFRRYGAISYLAGNTMYYFTGRISQATSGCKIEGDYLMRRSLRRYFLLVIFLGSTVSVGIFGVAVMRILQYLAEGMAATDEEIYASMSLAIAPVILVLGGYFFFGVFKFFDQQNRNILFNFLKQVAQEDDASGPENKGLDLSRPPVR